MNLRYKKVWPVYLEGRGTMTNPDNNETFTRNKWTVHPGFPLMTDDGRRKFLDIDAIPSFYLVDLFRSFCIFIGKRKRNGQI